MSEDASITVGVPDADITVGAADESIEVEGFVVVGPSPTGDHNHEHGTLTGLADPDHPISAVIGLDTALAGKEAAGTAASAVSAHAAAADPHTGYQRETEKAAANGYASLDATTKVPFAQLPTGTGGTQVAVGNHAHTAQTPGHTVEDEGVALTQRAALNFAGAGVTVTDTGSKTLVTIPSSGGVTDHGALTGLTDPDHPIAAVSGLQTALDGKVPASIVDAKGDLIVATAADTVTRLPVGTTAGHALVVDSTTATGMKWAAVSGGGGGTPGVLLAPTANPAGGVDGDWTPKTSDTDATALLRKADGAWPARSEFWLPRAKWVDNAGSDVKVNAQQGWSYTGLIHGGNGYQPAIGAPPGLPFSQASSPSNYITRTTADQVKGASTTGYGFVYTTAYNPTLGLRDCIAYVQVPTLPTEANSWVGVSFGQSEQVGVCARTIPGGTLQVYSIYAGAILAASASGAVQAGDYIAFEKRGSLFTAYAIPGGAGAPRATLTVAAQTPSFDFYYTQYAGYVIFLSAAARLYDFKVAA